MAFAATSASRAAREATGMELGIYDNTKILFGNPDIVFPTLAQMNTHLIRVDLWWGGPFSVVRERPDDPTDPGDPAYQWGSYDRAVQYAQRYRIDVLFSILGTPGWANGHHGWNAAPTDPHDLEEFAEAAARRYSGGFDAGGVRLPRVRLWMVWNEPNNPVFLQPQWVRIGGVAKIQSARNYAEMCNAAVAGIRHAQRGARIACGATSPRGNNNPNSARPSVSPVAFLTAMHDAGATGFDAIAHHPYYGQRTESPSTPPPPGARGQAPTAVTLGNFNVLTRAVDRLWGKDMRIWVTEYGYQTNPPDRLFGVSLETQATYLQQAYDILHRNPRVDVFVWFLLRDEGRLDGWQSGLYTVTGKRKDAREVFERLGRRK